MGDILVHRWAYYRSGSEWINSGDGQLENAECRYLRESQRFGSPIHIFSRRHCMRKKRLLNLAVNRPMWQRLRAQVSHSLINVTISIHYMGCSGLITILFNQEKKI